MYAWAESDRRPVSLGKVRECRTSSFPLYLPVDPLQPVLSTVSRHKILQVIGRWDALTLSGSQKVLPEANLVPVEQTNHFIVTNMILSNELV